MEALLGKAELDIFERLVMIWNFQLFTVDNSPITLGKVLIGLSCLVFGYFFAGLASRYVGKRVIRRLQIQSSLQYTLERVLFYVFYVFSLLFVLQLLSIPIGVFGAIGSVLAIGIGFGSQNVVNNFISGLIVMIEQPMRVGDWIEIDGTFGRVEAVGSRSTYLRLLDNKQAVVPNSFFLEKMLVNWTLADNMITGKVNISVAYGSDTEKVRAVLLDVATSHPSVLKHPPPSVIFGNFGESSLDFILGFSVELSDTITVGAVSSELRFDINKRFNEKSISMPFPHRELIINGERPIAVEVRSPKH